MKKSIWFTIIITLNVFTTQFPQDFPTKPQVLKIIGDINNSLTSKGEKELNVDTEKPMRFINAKFTNNKRAECIIICPVLFGWNSRELTIMFSRKNNDTKWIKDAVYFSQNAPYSMEEVDTIDVNNDGTYELLTFYSSMIRGYEKSSWKIITFQKGKEEIIYSNSGFRFPSEDEFISGKTVGDIIFEEYDIRILDTNSDGLKEIIEIKKTGLLLSKFKNLNDEWIVKVQEDSSVSNYIYMKNKFVKSN